MREAIIQNLMVQGFGRPEAEYVTDLYAREHPSTWANILDAEADAEWAAEIFAADIVSWHGPAGSPGTAGCPVSPFARN